MSERSFLGQFEQMVLLAIMRLGEDAYGLPIRRELEEQTGKPVARGALYTTLDRLEKKGYLTSRMGDPSPERGGRAKRFFQVTSPGVRALDEARNALMSLWRGLESELEASR